MWNLEFCVKKCTHKRQKVSSNFIFLQEDSLHRRSGNTTCRFAVSNHLFLILLFRVCGAFYVLEFGSTVVSYCQSTVLSWLLSVEPFELIALMFLIVEEADQSSQCQNDNNRHEPTESALFARVHFLVFDMFCKIHTQRAVNKRYYKNKYVYTFSSLTCSAKYTRK